MEFRDDANERRVRQQRARTIAFGSLAAVTVLVFVIVIASTGGSGTRRSRAAREHSHRSVNSRTAATGPAKPTPGAVPILAYNIVNVQPSQSSAPADLYVSAGEFSTQMNALKASGWHAITLDQLASYWTNGVSPGSGKPIVITFDGGYASHYSNALPVLKSLGWPGVENIQVNGLPPSDGGLTDTQVRALLAAGWELDTEGASQTDLTSLSSGDLSNQVAGARQTLRARYGVPVNWFAYPSGRYDATVVGAVRAAGFSGATTASPGWASPQGDHLRLPRLRVVGGTTPSKLLSQIAAAQPTTSTPASVP
jgi:peptidoglycan/xylan/chitin deacetylase (PgdA/CDA1 family)